MENNGVREKYRILITISLRASLARKKHKMTISPIASLGEYYLIAGRNSLRVLSRALEPSLT